MFNEEIKDATGHVCLQHGKTNTKARCSSGFKNAVPTMMDLIAFLPPFPFHISASLLLDELAEAEQVSAVKYLKGELKSPSQFSLITDENGMYNAKWKSSFKEVREFAQHIQAMQKNQIGELITWRMGTRRRR